jgi:hypothetical protein
MTYDKKSAPYHRKDISAEVRKAKRLLRHRARQGAYATVAFFLSCASVVPFAKGFPLHNHWEPLGRLFVCLSMGMLVVFVIFVGRVFNAWLFVREMEKIDE